MTADVSLRPATRQDLDRIYEWRCDPDVYEHFREQDEPLEWSDHVAWWRSRSEDREDYIIMLRERPVGVVAIAADGDIGVYVGETDLWGQGIGSGALELAIRRTDREDLHTEVHVDNERSVAMVEGLGFGRVGRDGAWLEFELQDSVSE